MKYTVEGFQQEPLVNLGLDHVDATLLRWFVDFQDTGSMVEKHYDEKSYHWIKYSAIISDLPCLGIKTPDAVGRRFKKMVKAGILEIHVEKNQRGTFSMFRRGPKYVDLVRGDSHTVQKSDAHTVQKSDAHTVLKPDHKILLSEDSSIRESSMSFKEIIEYLNTKTGGSFRDAESHRKHIRARGSEGATVDDFKRVIDQKASDWLDDNKMKQYLRPSTLFGTKFDSYLSDWHRNHQGPKRDPKAKERMEYLKSLGSAS